jgi:hypothetical protein
MFATGHYTEQHMTNIDLSSIEHNLETIACLLFRAWTEEVERRHQGQKIAIADESVLPQDLKDSISSALISVSKEMQNTHEWKTSFVLGFIQSNLDHHWRTEYIEKQGNDYKMILMLQALEKELMRNREVVEEIELRYQEDIGDSCNFQNIDTRILVTLPVVQMQMEFPWLARLQHFLDSDLFSCLANVKTEKVLAFSNRGKYVYLPKLDFLFPRDIISQLITLNCDDATDLDAP